MSSDESRMERLEARIERLEAAVRDLQASVAEDATEEDPSATPDRDAIGREREETEPEVPGSATVPAADLDSSASLPPAAQAENVTADSSSDARFSLRSEDWLSYVGMGLLLFGLVPASPFAALWASRLLWTGSDLLWASVAGGGALLYSVVYLGLRRESLSRYAPTHGHLRAQRGPRGHRAASALGR